MNLRNNIYNPRSNGSTHGDVSTRSEVVSFMLDAVEYTSLKDLSKTRILEPSCGNGEFVIEILSRLQASAICHGFDFNTAYHQCVLACDIDPTKIKECIRRIKETFPELHDAGNKIVCEDFLLSSHTPFDIIIGNPPYIRYEEIPIKQRTLYKSLFGTFHYRPDIYVLFFEKSILMLNPNGLHCFVCANRWMKNQYGKKLRCMIASDLRIRRIIDMEHVNAFHEEVLAYPAITILEKSSRSKHFEFASAKDIIELNNLHYLILDTPSDEDWSRTFAPTVHLGSLTSIESQGFKIGIGVATGADSIFVSPSLPRFVEKELLLPALNARNLSGNTFSWDGRYLLNPYEENGKLIRLEDYPLAKAYLESHYEKLAKRHKAARNPLKWYATIDTIKRSLLKKTKIMLPDISGNQFLFIDKGNYYPQHNLYYITGKDELSLKLLAALLTSDFVKNQLDCLSNHMNGGYARWQSQYLRKLCIPELSAIPKDMTSSLLVAYEQHNHDCINLITEEIVANAARTLQKSSKAILPKQMALTLDYI